MIIYGIEDYERKKRKKWIIIVITAILIIGMSIFGGIKMAEYVSNSKNQKLAENDDINQDTKQTEENNATNQVKNDKKDIENGNNDKNVNQVRSKQRATK